MSGLAWTPPGANRVVPVEAGRWWDAVRLPRDVAERALSVLGSRTGAVIEDRGGAYMYWLVRPRSAGGWTAPEGARVLGDGSYVAVPPQGQTGRDRVYWRMPLEPGQYLTDIEDLRAAVDWAAQ